MFGQHWTTVEPIFPENCIIPTIIYFKLNPVEWPKCECDMCAVWNAICALCGMLNSAEYKQYLLSILSDFIFYISWLDVLWCQPIGHLDFSYVAMVTTVWTKWKRQLTECHSMISLKWVILMNISFNFSSPENENPWKCFSYDAKK